MKVARHTNLLQSLETLHTGSRGGSATLFTALPEMLVFRLERLVPDEAFQPTKLNDKFTFPFKLSMAPYTSEEGIAASGGVAGCSYDLVGVVIHSGTRVQLFMHES